jgi:hypothetical protein
MLRRLLSVKRLKPVWTKPKDTLPHEHAEAEEKESWWQEQLASGETWTRKNHVYK